MTENTKRNQFGLVSVGAAEQKAVKFNSPTYQNRNWLKGCKNTNDSVTGLTPTAELERREQGQNFIALQVKIRVYIAQGS